MPLHQTAVITICMGSAVKKMAAMTTPTMKAYADKIGADFIIIEKVPGHFNFQEYSAYFAKFILRDFLDQYSRIIYLDLDILVAPHCPNLFDIVPEDHVGAMAEDDHGKDMTYEIDLAKGEYGNIKWESGYFNSGVMVVSQMHKDIFKWRDNPAQTTNFKDQTLLNHNLQTAGLKLFKLSHQFNHMHILQVDHSNRHESYISHYAAIPQIVRDLIIEEDLLRREKGLPLVMEEEVEGLILAKLTPEEIQSIGYLQHNTDEYVFS